MKITKHLMYIVFILLLLTLDAFALDAASVCPEDSLKFGMSTPLTGPASQLGINMRDGILTSFSEVNSSGRISGKELCLVAVDDGYEPERTVPNMHTLLMDEKVLALVGNVGTPTAVVAIPIATRNKTLFFGALSGAGILRKMPPERYVINFRASYAEETAAMVEGLITYGGIAANEIAFFTQRDAFGDAGFSGGMAALQRRGDFDEKLIAHGRYERNTIAVENGLADILMTNPEPKAVIMVGAYAPCAAFIKLARRIGLKALFLNISVGAAPLAQELGSSGEGVIITQVVPHYDSNEPVVVKFRKGLKEYQPQAAPSFGALEGYLVGNILIRALREIDRPLTREAIVDALEGLGEFDIGLGEPLRLTKTEHQASHQVWPTIIRNGKVVPLNWAELTWKK